LLPATAPTSLAAGSGGAGFLTCRWHRPHCRAAFIDHARTSYALYGADGKDPDALA